MWTYLRLAHRWESAATVAWEHCGAAARPEALEHMRKATHAWAQASSNYVPSGNEGGPEAEGAASDHDKTPSGSAEDEHLGLLAAKKAAIYAGMCAEVDGGDAAAGAFETAAEAFEAYCAAIGDAGDVQRVDDARAEAARCRERASSIAGGQESAAK